ncbi:RNA polymerase sigma factor [Peribacillus muralis]|uniref:RNA polymerase sigma factor n=1 Tax=Peribacillus muralis TaxID=264697 RepID=UPI00070A9DC2|nr:sigma-70 family RNA polymerase sigma factor [Peribacillus muralis]
MGVDVDCCRCIKIETLKENVTKFEEDKLFQEFLNDGNNKADFFSLLNTPTTEKAQVLDLRFREFFRQKKILNYLYGMIRRFAVDYDKRVRRRNMNYLLILDKQVGSGDDFNKNTLTDLIPSNAKTPLEETLVNEEQFFLENEELRRVFINLKQKQKDILKMYYVEGLTNKEIGQRLNKSPQNIQYWHKKSIQELYKSLTELAKDGAVNE